MPKPEKGSVFGLPQLGQSPRRALKGSVSRQIPMMIEVIMPVIGMKRVSMAEAPQKGRVKRRICRGAGLVGAVATVLRIGWFI